MLEGVNPSCGDDIFLKLKLDGDVIADGAFVGDGCAISQASADIMLGMIVGKKKEDALKMGEIFLKMIQGEASEDEIDSLEEASALRDIAHMPALSLIHIFSGKRKDIGAALPQRQQVQRQHVQAVVEVLAETSLPHELGDILVLSLIHI